MEGEDVEQEKQTYLYHSFPDIDETALACLMPWPSGEQVVGSFYQDLYGPASTDPLIPSLLSRDPYLLLVAQVRSCLAHFAIIQFSGAFEVPGHASQVAYDTVYKFSALYGQHLAVLIQRFWKAKRKGATKKDKILFGLAMITRPNLGANREETDIRKRIISDMLTACPVRT